MTWHHVHVQARPARHFRWPSIFSRMFDLAPSVVSSPFSSCGAPSDCARATEGFLLFLLALSLLLLSPDSSPFSLTNHQYCLLHGLRKQTKMGCGQSKAAAAAVVSTKEKARPPRTWACANVSWSSRFFSPYCGCRWSQPRSHIRHLSLLLPLFFCIHTYIHTYIHTMLSCCPIHHHPQATRAT
jgi:hypothetical protein